MCVQFKVALGEDFPPPAAFRSRAAVHPHVDLRHHYEILQASRLRNGDHRILSVDPESCGDCFCLSVNGIETVDLYLPGCRPVLRAVLVPERSEPGETDRIYNDGISVLLLIINLAFGTTKYGAPTGSASAG